MTGAAVLAMLAGLVALANAILVLTHGKAMLRDMANSLVKGQLDGLSSADIAPLINDAVNTAYRTLQSRAYIGIVLAVVYLALAAPIRRGGNRARVGMTIFVFVPFIMAFIDLADTTPTLVHILDGVGLACGITMLIALWLPASNSYVRAHKAR